MAASVAPLTPALSPKRGRGRKGEPKIYLAGRDSTDFKMLCIRLRYIYICSKWLSAKNKKAVEFGWDGNENEVRCDVCRKTHMPNSLPAAVVNGKLLTMPSREPPC
jgi:hypothetical protein